MHRAPTVRISGWAQCIVPNTFKDYIGARFRVEGTMHRAQYAIFEAHRSNDKPQILHPALDDGHCLRTKNGCLFK